MLIVPKDIYGDIKWGKEIEVESLEAFASERNKKMREFLGRDGQWFWIVSERMVEHIDTAGRIVETYHLCARMPCRLI